ncbi:MAG TPA: GTPase HflX, partial [Solirubrobacteraceae bacterium]|nr:GTPase HflX [Solirubrobacteraceae bacterium]
DIEAMTRAVEDVLEEIGAGESPRLLVLNKSDLLDDLARARAQGGHRDAVLVSAQTGDGLELLRERIEASFAAALAPVELLFPYSEGARLAELHELAGELEREDTADGVLVRALLPPRAAARFARFAHRNGSRP